MAATLKNLYIDKSDNMADVYNNKFYITIKMKPIDVKTNTKKFMINYLTVQLIKKHRIDLDINIKDESIFSYTI